MSCARRCFATLVMAAAIASFTSAVDAQDPVRLYAAGSLRAAMSEIASAFTKATGVPVTGEFGASGLLRERLAKDERGDVFASANLEHPSALAAQGKAGTVVLFARNRMCALVGPRLAVTSETLLDRMLDASVKLGTSTPKADPSGDYAFELFVKAEALRPGARATLERKALLLTGGPTSPPPPRDRNVYGALVSEGSADIFLTYCTNARAAKSETPALAVVPLPDALAVGANYGMTLLTRGGADAARFALFVVSIQGQRILAAHGFDAPALP